ncbi:MAG: hypothetical protein WBQ23_05215 [Bacteroidota bacterium]
MRIATLAIFAIIFSACSSTPARPAFSDFMEIRGIKNDDPLAAKFVDKDGEEFRLGDQVVSGKTITRLQVKRVSDERFDLFVTLSGVEDLRWRRFVRSKVDQAALVIDGSICCIFNVTDPGPQVENKLLVVCIPDVAQSQEEADKLDRYLEDGKAARRKRTDE